MKNLAGKVSHLLIAGMLVMSGCGGKGDTGTAGVKGGNGDQGAPGINGDAGIKGTNGTNGTTGTNGATGDAGMSTAPVSLLITNSITNAAVPGATVTLAPTGTIAIDATTGKGSANLAIGDYTLTIKATGYTTGTQDIEVVAGFTEAVTIKLVPTANVVANAGPDLTGQALGATVTLPAATASVLDGSTGTTYSWKQVSGPTATLTGTTTAAPSVTLPNAAVVQSALIDALTSATDVTSATNGDPIRRLDVVGINPFSIEEATTVGLQVTVTTSSGTYMDTVNVAATSPFQVTTGLRNVPIGIPELLQGDPGVTWAWTVTSAPAASTATITGAATQFPMFTPDVAGTYVLSEASGAGSLKMYAGTWSTGALDKTNVDPKTDKALGIAPPATCGLCHDDVTAPNKWADWSKTGHSFIVPENIDVAGNHWSMTACGSCHSVGYNTTATNGGADEALAAILAETGNSKWTVPNGAPGSYYSMLNSSDPNIAKLAGQMNVQCENCHGPNTSGGHKTHDNTKATYDGTARVSLKAEVCGSCHGEPTRHGRYQQWQDSKHANTSLAMQRAAADATTPLPAYPASDATNCDATCQATWASTTNNGNHCARCHSGEGFVIWQDQASTRGMDFNKKIQGAAGDATLTELVADGLVKANVHSQTCATCHDPHDVGMTAQEQPFIDPTTGQLSDPTKNNTAKVRVMDDIAMLPAGFPAPGLGKGSICATCHNGRNGAHNDSVTTYGSTGISTPHDSTAAEVLLGQNVYFVTNGQRGGHSFIANACVNCHMELTPQPANYSFPGTGTNHSFAADMSICKNCHGAFDGGSIQTATKASLTNLTQFIGSGAAKALNGKVVWARAQRVPVSTDTTTFFSHAAAASASDLTAYSVKVDLTSGVNSITSAILLADTSNVQITLANAIPITWTDNTTGTPAQVKTFIISMSNIRNDDSTGTTPMATLPISLTGNLAKAIWNYITLNREGSFGIHNPGFTNQVIGATMAQDMTQ